MKILPKRSLHLHITGTSPRVIAKMARPSFIVKSELAAAQAGEGHWLYSPFGPKPGDASKPKPRVYKALPFLLAGKDPRETRATGFVEAGMICTCARFGSQTGCIWNNKEDQGLERRHQTWLRAVARAPGGSRALAATDPRVWTGRPGAHIFTCTTDGSREEVQA